jgi:MFS family permease
LPSAEDTVNWPATIGNRQSRGIPQVDGQRQAPGRWYEGVTRYQWLVLVVASLGWIFDVFEGQLFVAGMNEAMPALLPEKTSAGAIAFYNNVTFAAFLLGGAAGGVAFGLLADRIGRKRTLSWTILAYSLFTCLSAFAQSWWHMAVCRFLVALGVGGEWAVASALVAEVFPLRARARSQSLFHASSVLGTFLAIAAGAFLVAVPVWQVSLPWSGQVWQMAGWRLSFLAGVVPALLIIWIRAGLREPDVWLQSRRDQPPQGPARTGSVAGLFTPKLRRRTLVGVGLAAVGLATFWGTHIYGKDMFRRAFLEQYPGQPGKQAEMLGMLLVTTGGGLGLVSFGPLAERLGRRGAFLLFQLGGLAAALVVFGLPLSLAALGVVLPLFGFLTLGMHAGYAVYFPELFPTRLRGTGGGFCFNVGRLIAAPILFLGGWMQKDAGFSLPLTASALSLLFLPGMLLLLAAPETRGQGLPE